MGIIKKNSFVSGAGVYLFSNILNGVIPFLLLPILTRYLNPTQYGEVAMFQTLLGALGAFVGTNFAGASIRKYYDKDITDKELSEFMGSCIQLVLVFSSIVFLMLFIFQAYFSKWLGLDAKYVLFAVFVAFSTVIIRFRLLHWQARKKAVKYGVFQISQSLVNSTISLVLVVLFLQGAEGRIEAQIITSFVFLIIALFLLFRSDLLKIFVWRKDYLKEALRYAVPLIPHVGGLFLLSSVDRVVINNQIGLAAAGIYMVAIQLTSVMNIVFDAVNKAYVPWLFEKLKEDDLSQKEKIVKITYIWYFVILLGVSLAFLIGPFLVTTIAGENYSQAGELIGWLALGQGFNGMYLMVTNYILFSKRTSLLSSATISSGILNVLLLILFTNLYGLEGAAKAFALSMIIRFLLTWFLASKTHPMPWFNIFIKRSL